VKRLLLVLLLLAAPAAAEDPPAGPAAEQVAVDERLRIAAFDPARLRERRRALVKLLPAGSVLVCQAGPRGDDTWPYRPSPDFLYLSGQRDAGLSLLVSADEDVLFVPPKDERHELWNGARVVPGAQGTGFGEVADASSRPQRLARALEKGATLFVVGVDPEQLGVNPPPPARRGELKVHQLRQVKDAGEVALLARAIDITGAALIEAIRSVGPAQTEHEVQGVIEYLFTRYGAQRPGFASICGSGPNSCVLHYQANRRRLQAGDLIVMDVGAELWGYTADVTRTVPVSGKFTKRQREIYDLVLAAQKAGIAAVRPGVTLREVDGAARKVIRDAGYGQYFPHGTSHWLGMDVHDVGAYERALEPGMVLTVEPGIYLPGEALGVRIEDDVVVTSDGCRLLSGLCPRTADELEALLAEEGVGNREVAPLQQGGGGGDGKKFFRMR
jgi:Xaa-Pro aminopeptidase